MAKKYEKESDFRLLNFKLKSRIKELLENKVGAQAIMLVATEISDLAPEVKAEMIDFIDFLIKKLEININGTYSSKNLKKAQEASNQFYLAQMKKLFLEDKKKQQEGFFKEKTYLSSNAIFVEDVEAEIGQKTVELQSIAEGSEINARYIIEASDNAALRKVANSTRLNNVHSDTPGKPGSFNMSQDSKMSEMLKAKEEEELREMENLRRELQEKRIAEEAAAAEIGKKKAIKK